jgi:hypothetical protein
VTEVLERRPASLVVARIIKYTMAHEAGHLLGLGEGYRSFVTRTIRSGGGRAIAGATDRELKLLRRASRRHAR